MKITCKTELILLLLETFHYILRSVIQCPMSLLLQSQEKKEIIFCPLGVELG